MQEKLYLTVEEAAAYVGIGVKTMRDYVNSSTPPPYLEVGRKRMLEKAALPGYFRALQTVK